MDKLSILKYKITKVLPAVYDDSLSYYEVLAKVVHKLNELIENETAQTDAISEIESDVEGLNDRFVEFSENINSTIETALKDYDGYNNGKVLGVVDNELKWIDNGGGGGGGTSDYDELQNKPEINGVELTGNKTSNELNLQPTILKNKTNNPNSGQFNAIIDDASNNKILSFNVKGHSILVNQIVQSESNSSSYVIPTGHIYYSFINGIENIGISTGESITADSENNDLIYDLTVSGFTTEETINIETFKTAWYNKFGFAFTNSGDFTYGDEKVIYFYSVPNIGFLGRNLLDPLEAIMFVKPNESYYVKSEDQIEYTFADYFDNDISSGTINNDILVAPNNAYRLLINSPQNLENVCINISDPNFNGNFEEYTNNGLNIDGNINVPLFSVNNVYDEQDFVKGIRITRCNMRQYQSGDESNPDVITDGYSTIEVLPTPIVENTMQFNLTLNENYNNIYPICYAENCLNDFSIIYYDKSFMLPAEQNLILTLNTLITQDTQIPLNFFNDVFNNNFGIIVDPLFNVYYYTQKAEESNTGRKYLFFTALIRDSVVTTQLIRITIVYDGYEAIATAPYFGKISTPVTIEIPINTTSGTITLTNEQYNALKINPSSVTVKAYLNNLPFKLINNYSTSNQNTNYYSTTAVLASSLYCITVMIVIDSTSTATYTVATKTIS